MGRSRVDRLADEVDAAERAVVDRPAPFVGTILDFLHIVDLDGPSHSNWLTWQKSIDGLPLSEDELQRFRFHTGRSDPMTAPVTEAVLVVGRRGGKSVHAAARAAFQAVRYDYSNVLRRGARGVVLCIAADRQQSREIINYLRGFFQTEELSPYLERSLADSIVLSNGITIRVSAASYKSTRGFTVVCVVADELAFWSVEDGSANPDSAILTALRPGMLTVPGALLLLLSSPYAAKGELFKAHQRLWGTNHPRAFCWNASTQAMNPGVSADYIADEFEKDPVSAASEYGIDGKVAFRTDVASFLDPDAIRAVVVTDRLELAPLEEVQYFAFTDPSGGRNDSFTLAIAHNHDGRAVLDLVREVKPPLSPDSTIEDFADTLKRYGLSKVTGDRYGGEFPPEKFREYGITYEASERAKSDIYRDVLPLINSGNAELLDLPRIAAQFAVLERRTARGGKDTIDHQRGTKDDVANAVAGALTLAAGRKARRRFFVYTN